MKKTLILALISLALIGCAGKPSTADLYKEKAIDMAMKGNSKAVDCYDANWHRNDWQERCAQFASK